MDNLNEQGKYLNDNEPKKVLANSILKSQKLSKPKMINQRLQKPKKTLAFQHPYIGLGLLRKRQKNLSAIL